MRSIESDSAGAGGDSQQTRLLIVLGLALVAAAIARVRSETGETAFLSANDRSRWAAMAAMVHESTAVTDRPQAFRDPKTKRRTLQSIDRVMHVGKDGEFHSYSSKPPLLVFLYAIPYTVVHVLTGASVYTRPLMVGRWTLALAHLLPLAVYWWCMAEVIRRSTPSPWTRCFLVVVAIFGTHVTSFSATVNNHGPGAWAALAALALALRTVDARRPLPWAFGAGLAAALGVVCELPALAWCAALGGFLMLYQPRAALLGYGSGALAVAIAFLATNVWAHGSWRPPYAHRGLGAELVTLPPSALPPTQETPGLADWVTQRFGGPVPWTILPALRKDHWEVRITHDASMQRIRQRFALVPQSASGNAEVAWKLHTWDDWYDYPGTYWAKGAAKGVDRGEPSPAVYAFQSLLGHHGLLSLTPVWFFAICGALLWWRRGAGPSRMLAAAIVVTTLACLVFYFSRPIYDRNYGGVSCCFRWMVWLAPLWIWLSIPCVERLGSSRWGRAIALLALAVSSFSMVEALAAPWQHPWIYRYWSYLGWIVER